MVETLATDGSESEYNSLIKNYAHRGEVDAAEDLFRKMVSSGAQVSALTLNGVIHACTQAGDIERAEMYLEGMDAGGIEPDIITYNSVINACAARAEPSRAEFWLLRMIEKGLNPNEVTYGTICKAFARTGNVEAVLRIMGALEATMPLNEYFYASLISACGAASPPDIGRAEAAVMELASRGLRTHAIKRALARVVGERRSAELMQMAISAKSEGPKTQSEAPLHAHDSVQPPGLWREQRRPSRRNRRYGKLPKQ